MRSFAFLLGLALLGYSANAQPNSNYSKLLFETTVGLVLGSSLSLSLSPTHWVNRTETINSQGMTVSK